jgi:integrase
MNPKKAYNVRQNGHRSDGTPFFDVILGSSKRRLDATTREAAEAEAKALYAKGDLKPNLAKLIVRSSGTLRDAFVLYLASDAFKLYKPLTNTQRRSTIEIVLRTPVKSGRHSVGETKLIDWLHGPEATDAILHIMGLCGDKAAAANKRLQALDLFFKWLLKRNEPQAGAARLAFNVGPHATNPCRDIEKAEMKRDARGRARRGYQAFTGDQVNDWLIDSKDNVQENRTIRLLQITGARLSDLYRLNRSMVKTLDNGERVLTYTCTKGKDSAFWAQDAVAVVPMVPELEALIDELPTDQLMFIVSEHGHAYSCPEGLGNRIRKWRRSAGLPEGLSAHGMRKAATHWWLRNHRDLIANNFSLKTIFGWATDKELDRYTRDFNREEEARGMLVRLADRRKQTA